MLEENQIGQPGALGIDPELLEPVYRLPGVFRVVDHVGAGELYDACLRRLSRQEALCRRILGRLAERLLSRQSWRELGFIRLSDWSRERMGISGREVQSFARVARGLESPPSVAAAFDAGELSWTKARILVTVATPETEKDWLERAGWMTTRSLEDEVRKIAEGKEETDGDAEEAEPASPAASPLEALLAARKATARKTVASELLDEIEATVDGEEKAFFRLRCPRRLLLLWKETV